MEIANLKPSYFSWNLARYVAREVLGSFFIGTTIFLLIMLMFQAIRLSEFVVVHQVSLRDVGRLSSYLMLSFIPIAVPVAFLFAVLMGISRANSEGEIIGLQVSGISLGQIYGPLGVFSLFVTAFCLVTSLWTVPQGNRNFELLITKLSNERVMSALKPGVFLEGFYGLTVFAEHIIPAKNEMHKVFLYDDRDEKFPLFITAQSGILRGNAEQGQMTLRLTSGTIHIDRKGTEKASENVQQKIDFDVYDINLEVSTGGDFWRDYSLPSLNYEQIQKERRTSLHDTPHYRAMTVELHRRISLSFSCVIFSALGFFIGTLSQKGIRSTAIILCIMVGVVYWLAFVAAHALAHTGWVAPWLGIWVPNIVFGFIAWLCYRRYRRGP